MKHEERDASVDMRRRRIVPMLLATTTAIASGAWLMERGPGAGGGAHRVPLPVRFGYLPTGYRLDRSGASDSHGFAFGRTDGRLFAKSSKTRGVIGLFAQRASSRRVLRGVAGRKGQELLIAMADGSQVSAVYFDGEWLANGVAWNARGQHSLLFTYRDCKIALRSAPNTGGVELEELRRVATALA
jgi:hypothetical protein